MAQTRFTGREAGALVWVGVQVGVILLLARAFHLESPAFYDIVLPLAAGGFFVHHWLPRGYQLWFFVALSVAGIVLVFGLVSGAWLVGVGLGLIALCHLPIAFRWRIVLILLAAAGLVAMRAAWLPAPWPGVIWPVLGSIFMFRLAMYLYDLKHRGPGAPGFVLSYFFLLPNTVFLLFPVIDFQTFRRTHFDKPAFEIYGEGIRWMFRGLTHLVIYRVIYQYVALSPADVTSTATLVQYLVGNYGLYLRVSGQFHMIVGMLHLFGFRLPETHRFFYLASSFSDLWRRINIYWKDFMQKMVYLPVVFGLKRQGETTALVVATMCVVIATWLLHSYQWFWLLGEWLLSATDMAFWGVIGLLLIASTLREQRRGRERQLTAQAPASPHAWSDAVQTAGMFALMAFLWAVWTSPSFGDFRVMLEAATLRGSDVAVVAGTLAFVAAAAYISRRFALGAPSALAVRPRWQHPLVVSALPLALFWAAGESAAAGRVPESIQTMAQQARLFELNKYDAERMQRGYYEQIVGVNRFNGQLWEVYARADEQQNADDILFGEEIEPGPGASSIWRRHSGALGHSLVPSNRTTFKGARFTTNRWGMRDKEYEKEPSPRTRRIAVLGQSYTMGAGVNDDEVFEALIEDRLNREWSPKTGFQYELLNFSVSGYSLDKHALLLTNGRVSEFHPDVVLIAGNPGDMGSITTSILRQLRQGFDLSEPLAKSLTEAGVTKDMPETEALARLRARGSDAGRVVLETISSEARRMGAQLIYAVIPMPRTRGSAPLMSLAADEGLLAIDLRDVYEGHDPRTLTLSDTDFHPNREGHRLIAERLYKDLVSMPLPILTPGESVTPEERARLETEWNRKQVAGQQAVQGKVAFNQATPWAVQTTNGAIGKMDPLPDGGMRVTIAALPQKVGWHLKLRQGPLMFTKDGDYRVSFRARADVPRPMGVGAERDVPPYRVLGFYKSFDVTTQWQTWEWTFTASETEPVARLFFDLGESQTPAEITDVVIVDVATGLPVTVRPNFAGRSGK